MAWEDKTPNVSLALSPLDVALPSAAADALLFLTCKWKRMKHDGSHEQVALEAGGEGFPFFSSHGLQAAAFLFKAWMCLEQPGLVEGGMR